MNDDPVVQARVQARIQDQPERVAAPQAEVIRALETVLDRVRKIESRNLAVERNLAVQQALLDDRLLRVENNRLFTIWNTIAANGRNVIQLVRSALGRPPLHLLTRNSSLDQQAISSEYAKWVAREQACLPAPEQVRAVSDAWMHRPTISIILAIRHGRGLTGTLESIQNQVYGNWQLCLALDESCKAKVLPLVSDFEAGCGSVRHVVANGLDDARALNVAADMATGEYLAFINEAGTLAPLALYYIAESVQSSALDILYSDEDELDAEGHRARPVFKPDWSPDLLTSCMYMGRMLVIRREAFQQAGGLRSQYAGVHLHDLVLRLADAPVNVQHLRRVLHHSGMAGRPLSDGAGSPAAGPSSGNAATARVIEDAIMRREGTPAECVPGAVRTTFLVRRKSACSDMTAVICSKSPGLLEDCLASLRATADKAVPRIIVIAHEESGPDPALRKVIQQAGATAVSFGGAFNFSTMNNLGAHLAKTPNLLFLNDDVEATSKGWAEMLNEQVSREEVGISGAVLWYPSHLLQHAGLVAGVGDGIGHSGRYAASSDLWPWLLVTRNVSAVTGACLAIRKDLFQQLGGFDAAFPNNYNDVDLCFRVRSRGRAVICVPVPGLIHRECQSRRGVVRFEERYLFYKRWADFLGRPDPYYSPALASTEAIALNLDQNPWHYALLSSTGLGEP